MTTIICATNRPNNQTYKVVEIYRELLRDLGSEVQVFLMEDLPNDFLSADAYQDHSPAFNQIVQKYIGNADRFVVISPEYNGSFPGVFKGFIDAFSPSLWSGKKVGLIGVASGRAGNLRGMDHLTDIFHHMDVDVMPFKLPISRLMELFKKDKPKGELLDSLRLHAEKFHRS